MSKHKLLAALCCLFLVPQNARTSDGNCKKWLRESAVNNWSAEQIIMKLYKLRRTGSAQVNCLQNHYEQHHLDAAAHKQLYYNFRAQLYIQKGQFDSAKYYLHKALKQDSILQDSSKLSDDLGSLGNIKLQQRKLKESIELFKRALDAIRWEGQPHQKANLLTNLGVAYLEQELYSNAMKCFREAYEAALQDTLFDASGRRCLIRHNIGTIHVSRGQYKRAVEIFKPLVDSAQALQWPYLSRLAHGNLGNAYLKLGWLEKAETHLLKSTKGPLNFDYNQEELYLFLIDLYLEKEEAEKIKPLLDTIRQHYMATESRLPSSFFLYKGRYAQLIGSPPQAIAKIYQTGLSRLPGDSLPGDRGRFYEALADLYAQKANHQKAAYYLQLYNDALKEAHRLERERTIEDMAAIYDLEENRRRRQTAENQKKLALIRAEMAERRQMQYSLLAVLAIVIASLIAFSYWQFRKQSQSQQEAAEERNQRLSQEKRSIERQLEYQKNTVLDKSLWAARLRPQIKEAIRHYHKRPSYLERKVHQFFAEYNVLERFEEEFELFYPDFSRKLLQQSPSLTPRQLRYAMLVALGLSNKEVAELLAVSVKAVEMARYRLRDQLSIEKEELLETYLRNKLLETKTTTP